MRYELALDSSKAQSQMPGLTRMFGGLSKGALGAGAAIATVGLMANKAIGDAAEFQTAWAEVKTILALTTEENEHLAHSMHELSKAMPKSAVELTKGLYQVISAGITDAADAAEVLEVSAKAAIGGLSDTFTAVDVITSSLNAFEREASETTDIADTLFTAVREGKLTFDTLAESIGPVIPFFAQAGLKLDELSAAMATLTKGGLKAQIAATALRATIIAILKPSDEARETALKLGIAFNREALASKGLVGFLREIKEATRGNATEIVKLFPNVRALAGVLNLAGNQADEFQRIMGTMETRTGNSERAFAIMNDTLEAQSQIMKNKIHAAWVKAGDLMLGGMQKMITAFGKSSDTFVLMKENVAGLTEESKHLEEELLPLADEYDELVERGVKPGTKEFERQKEIMDLLVSVYPTLKREVNELGENVKISTDHLREMNTEAKRAATKEFEEALGKRSRELEKMQEQLKRSSKRLNELHTLQKEIVRFAAPGMGLGQQVVGEAEAIFGRGDPLARGRSGRNFLRESEFLSDLAANNRLIVEAQQKIEDFRTDLVALFKVKGIDGLIERWAALRDMQGESEVLAHKFAEVQARLAVELPNLFDAATGPAEEFRDILEQILEQMKEGRERVGLFGLDYGALPEPPPPLAAEKAAEVWRKAHEEDVDELQHFIEEQVGHKFWGRTFDQLDPIVKQFFQNQLNERKEAEQKAAREIEKIQKALHENMLRLIQKEAEARRKAALGALQAISAEPLSPGGKGAPGPAPPSSLPSRGLTDIFVEMMSGGGGEAAERFTETMFLLGEAIDHGEASATTFKLVMEEIAGMDKRLRLKSLTILRDFIAGLSSTAIDEGLRGELLVNLDNQIASLGETGGASLDAVRNLTTGILDLTEGLFGASPAVASFISGVFNIASAIQAGAGPLGILGAGLSVLGGLFSGQGKDSEEAAKQLKKLEDAIRRFTEAIVEVPGENLIAAVPIFEEMKVRIAEIKKKNDEIRRLTDEIIQAEYDGDEAKAARLRARREIVKKQRREEQEALEELKRQFEERFPDVKLPDGLDNLVDFINKSLADLEEIIANFGKFTIDTYRDLERELDFTKDLLDIEKPAEQLDLLIKRLNELTNVDWSFLQKMSVGDMEKALELIGQFVTGTGKGAAVREAIAGLTPEEALSTDLVKELSQLLGLPLDKTVALLEEILFNGITSTEEIAELILAMENLNDEMKASNEIGEESISVGRSVSITQQQGDTIVALMNSTMIFLRRI
jgi:TP901 family phage tail tape measure protein